MSKKLIPLVIDRVKWVRGANEDAYGETSLLNERGNMCCLGFACRALGFKPSTINDLGQPSDVVSNAESSSAKRHRLQRMLGSHMVEIDNYSCPMNSEWTSKAIKVNDDFRLTDTEREAKLKPILRRLGFSTKFVGPK